MLTSAGTIPALGESEAVRPAGATHSASALYREYGPLVERWALRLGGPGFAGSDGEDALQDVFAIVHRDLPRFRGDSKIATWLYGITENVVNHHRRRKQRLQGIRRWLGGSGADRGVYLGRAQPQPLESIERREANARVYAALDRMRDPYRSALILFELEELSGQEIAQLKGVPVATVWVWLHRARAQFLERLEGGGS